MIPVVDLFAGPGGLGEGFSAFTPPNPVSRFKLSISIEKDEIAHKTLLLRSFYRQFEYEDIPQGYYDFITQDRFNLERLNDLLDNFDEGASARTEALCRELGRDNEYIFRCIEESVGDRIQENLPWVLVGGPPCQAYSLVGRARNKGKLTGEANDQEWSLDTDDRSRLYLEYLKVLARFQPTVFIMENVKGMLSAKLGDDRIIDLITNDLQNPNDIPHLRIRPLSHNRYQYRLFSLTQEITEGIPFEPSDYVIKCEDYGIPQRRHRVIIMGVREDYWDRNFHILKPQRQVSLQNTIYDLPACFSNFSNRGNGLNDFDVELLEHNNVTDLINYYFLGTDFENDNLNNTIIYYLERLGQRRRGPRNSPFDPDWFLNNRLNGHFCNHEPRTHMRSDFLRYFFASCFGEAFGRSPKLEDFPEELLPAHENVDAETFVDRFKVQLKDIPSTTVTCHISKDGHYYIHPDPRQCRSLTVREAARLQTFPDDYFFCGNRTQQYHQVGNAVPPLLARQIAGIVHQILEVD